MGEKEVVREVEKPKEKEKEEVMSPGGILDITPKDDGNKLSKEVIETLFSTDTHKIIQASDFDRDDLYDVARIETFFSTFILKYCTYEDAMKYRIMIDKLYQSKVSFERKGRTELFDAITPTQTLLQMAEMQKGRKWF